MLHQTASCLCSPVNAVMKPGIEFLSSNILITPATASYLDITLCVDLFNFVIGP